MNKCIAIIVTILLFCISLYPSSIADEETNPPTVEINIKPFSVVYEGDVIGCDITGNPDFMYWSINNISHHFSFHGDDPVIFNPETTPLSDTYVNLTVYVENQNGNASDTVQIKLKKLFFGDIHWHTIFSDGDYEIHEMYENAISDNYLDFTASTDQKSWDYPSKTRLFPILKKIINKLRGRIPWEITKECVINYYDPGNFTTLLGFEWSGSNLFPGGYKISKDGCEDVSHVNFYYKDVYSEAQDYSEYEKLTYDDILKAMDEEYDKGHLNVGFPHHPQGKVYFFSSTLVKNPNLKNISFLHRFIYDFTTNFSYLANSIKNTEARDKIIRGVEIFSTWGTAIGPYTNGFPVTFPYYPNNPLLGVVCANKTEAWTENAMWEWSSDKFKGKKFAMQMGSDAHHIDRPGSAFLHRKKTAGLMAIYAVHNTREEIWDAMNNCNFYGSQLLKIRANARFNDQMALGRWINCTSPLKINISAMSTFQGIDSNKKTMCPYLYSKNELDYPISDVWIIKKDTDKGKPWCKIIKHWGNIDENVTVLSYEDPNVKPNDFYYIAIRQQGEELTPGENKYTAFLGPVFIDNVE